MIYHTLRHPQDESTTLWKADQASEVEAKPALRCAPGILWGVHLVFFEGCAWYSLSCAPGRENVDACASLFISQVPHPTHLEAGEPDFTCVCHCRCNTVTPAMGRQTVTDTYNFVHYKQHRWLESTILSKPTQWQLWRSIIAHIYSYLILSLQILSLSDNPWNTNYIYISIVQKYVLTLVLCKFYASLKSRRTMKLLNHKIKLFSSFM